MFLEASDKFLMNSSVAIHALSSDGIIQYANQQELDMLGYTKEEYVGHHTSEFQIDKYCLADMVERLSRFENLRKYPAKVRGKNSIKYIIYNSNVFQEDGKFIHTRCYGFDVEKDIYEMFRKTSPYF